MVNGIELTLWFQDIRAVMPDAFNTSVWLLSDALYTLVPICIILFLYWCHDKRAGTVICFCFSLAMSLTIPLKGIIGIPRPWNLDSTISIDSGKPSGLSCPSGHCTVSTASYGGVALSRRNDRLIVCAMILLIGITCTTRLYLGVHTILDAVVGVVLGLLLLIASQFLWSWSEKGEGRDTVLLLNVLALIIIAMGASFFLPTGWSDGSLIIDQSASFSTMCKYGSLTCGAILGLLFEKRFVGFDMPASCKVKRFAIGILSTALVTGSLFMIGRLICSDIGYLLGGASLMFYSLGIFPYIAKRFGL